MEQMRVTGAGLYASGESSNREVLAKRPQIVNCALHNDMCD